MRPFPPLGLGTVLLLSASPSQLPGCIRRQEPFVWGSWAVSSFSCHLPLAWGKWNPGELAPFSFAFCLHSQAQEVNGLDCCFQISPLSSLTTEHLAAHPELSFVDGPYCSFLSPKERTAAWKHACTHTYAQYSSTTVFNKYLLTSLCQAQRTGI